MTCAPSEDSDQTGQSDQSLHSPHDGTLGHWLSLEHIAKSLIRLNWADVQADLSLRWVHRSFCWFCHAAAQLSFSVNLALAVAAVDKVCFM